MYWIKSGIEILRIRWSLVVQAGMKKNEWSRRTDKSRTLKKATLQVYTISYLSLCFTCCVPFVWWIFRFFFFFVYIEGESFLFSRSKWVGDPPLLLTLMYMLHILLYNYYMLSVRHVLLFFFLHKYYMLSGKHLLLLLFLLKYKHVISQTYIVIILLTQVLHVISQTYIVILLLTQVYTRYQSYIYCYYSSYTSIYTLSVKHILLLFFLHKYIHVISQTYIVILLLTQVLHNISQTYTIFFFLQN